jgi:hypothetical protein
MVAPKDQQQLAIEFVGFDHVYWHRAADKLLDEYLVATRCQENFLAEQFVAWAASRIEAPPDPRAWGPVIQRAAHKKKIIRVGYAPATTSNGSPKCLWRARL